MIILCDQSNLIPRPINKGHSFMTSPLRSQDFGWHLLLTTQGTFFLQCNRAKQNTHSIPKDLKSVHCLQQNTTQSFLSCAECGRWTAIKLTLPSQLNVYSKAFKKCKGRPIVGQVHQDIGSSFICLRGWHLLQTYKVVLDLHLGASNYHCRH